MTDRAPSGSGPPASESEEVRATPASAAPPGVDLARAALARAKSDARARGRGGPGLGGSSSGRRAAATERSAAGPDERDPQRVGWAIRRLLRDRGWEANATVATVMGRWDALVGPDLSSHCRPERLVAGELVLVAESTAWATQVRLLAPALMARISEQLGAGVVTAVRVHGPTVPNWRHGPRRVTGERGPRDTYG